MKGSPQGTIHYLTSFRLFSSYQSELLYNYKYFIENLIMKLGEDWRIQSNLLSQEIIAFRSGEDPTKDYSDFNLFNEFLDAYLRDKIGKENEYSNYCESQIQKKFLQNVNLQFHEERIYNGLTFKTLSLGYCINATEVWNKTFKNPIDKSTKSLITLKPFGDLYLFSAQVAAESTKNDNKSSLQASSVRRKLENIDLMSSHLSLSQEGEAKNQSKQKVYWRKMDEQVLSQRQIAQIKKTFEKIPHTLKTTQVLSYFVSSIDELHLKEVAKVRIFSISNQFYLNAFIVWLIFNIKMFFSLNFSNFLRYFKDLASEHWKEEYERPLKKFQIILERQWSKLLKDFTVALHDDQEVLNILVERVKKCMQTDWESRLDSIKDSFHHTISPL